VSWDLRISGSFCATSLIYLLLGNLSHLHLKNESRVRHCRLSLKGGEEEKSPYTSYLSRELLFVLDGKPTITLRFGNYPFNKELIPWIIQYALKN
jgi:hypothetical protein